MKKNILLLVLALIGNLLYAQNIDYVYHLKDASGKAVTKANICIERGKTDDNGCFRINTKFSRAILIAAEGYEKVRLTLKADICNRVVMTPVSERKTAVKVPEVLKTDFEAPLYVINGTYIPTFKPSNYTNDMIAEVTTTNKWNKMQLAGAVFLPACGYRNGAEIGNVNTTGVYWTTTCKEQNNPQYLYFCSNYLSLTHANIPYYGQAVRLVCK